MPLGRFKQSRRVENEWETLVSGICRWDKHTVQKHTHCTKNRSFICH